MSKVGSKNQTNTSTCSQIKDALISFCYHEIMSLFELRVMPYDDIYRETIVVYCHRFFHISECLWQYRIAVLFIEQCDEVL